jgi:hypothetical protein
VTIGDVFTRAWDLWRRDVGWLILAGLVVGVIIGVLSAIFYGILMALIASAGTAVAVDSLNNSRSSLTGFGIGLGVTGLLVSVVGGFLIEVVAFTFYGGLFEMVIGAYRQQRGVEFADLFSGFRKFGSYALFAVVLAAIQFGLGLLNILPIIGWLISLILTLWITIIWLYVLPLIADHGLSFMEAAGKSRQMVRDAGWWWTFGMMFLLWLAAVIVIAIVVALSVLFGKADSTVGVVVGLLLFLLFAVLFPPYAICYVSVLYVGSGGDVAPVPAGGGMGAPSGGGMGVPAAPPAPPAYGATGYGAPGYGAPAYGQPAYGGTSYGTPAAPADADAWKAAADPLASAPPPPPPLAPAGQPPAAGAAVADDATAVTQAPPAGSAEAAAPETPEAPAPPAPPGT